MNGVQLYVPTCMSPSNIKFSSQKVADEYIQYFKFKIFETKQCSPQDSCMCGEMKGSHVDKNSEKFWMGEEKEIGNRQIGASNILLTFYFSSWVEAIWLFTYF